MEHCFSILFYARKSKKSSDGKSSIGSSIPRSGPPLQGG
jgi:hypothetical protein